MSLAICPGSFDPPTNGHIDVIERAVKHFDEVLVAVVENPLKAPLFQPSERVELLKGVFAHLDQVSVQTHDGLLVNLAKQRKAQVIVKGLRAVSDLEYELQMAQMNARLAPGVDTFFVATNPTWSFLSSSMVKEVASLGGDVATLVPPSVNEALIERLGVSFRRFGAQSQG